MEAIEGARELPRSQLLQPKSPPKPTTEDRIPFVLTFNPRLPSIPSIINKHWDILQNTSSTAHTFQKPPIVSYRQPSNLSKILVKSSLINNNSNQKSTIGEYTRCDKCNQCKFIDNTDGVKDNRTGSIHPIIGKITCNTSNLIYGIKCQKCDKLVYVGETGRKLKTRAYEHVYSIKKKKDTLVSEHFNQDDHDISNFKMFGVCKILSTQTKIRKQMEIKYIYNLGTIHPLGINKKDWLIEGALLCPSLYC